MQKEKNISTQEVISMEEYLNKRQKIREQEKKRFGGRFGEEKSPAWMMAELYVCDVNIQCESRHHSWGSDDKPGCRRNS